MSAGADAGAGPPRGASRRPARRDRLVEDRGRALGDRPPGRPGVVRRGQRPQRQEEFGHDDQHRERPVEGESAVHQSQADLDRDEGDRHRAAPFEDERGLERGPQHLHRGVAVLPADHRDVGHLLAASAECLERRETAQHVQEERAEVADLGESPIGDRPRPSTDEAEEEDEDRSGEQQDERGRRIEHQDDRQHQQRDGDRQHPGGLEHRDVGVHVGEPAGHDAGQFADPLAGRPARPEGEEVARQIRPKAALRPTRGAPGQRVRADEQRSPDDREPGDQDQQRRRRSERRPAHEDVGDDPAGEPGRRHDDHGREETAGDREAEAQPRSRRDRDQPLNSRADRRRSCPGRCSRRRPCRAARTASR